MQVRLAIATDDNGVSTHFGKCRTYTLVDIEDGRVIKKEAVTNPGFEGHQPGMIPRFLHEKGATIVIAGGMGQRAVDFFNEFGMQTVVGVIGDIDSTIEKFIRGSLQGGQNLHDLEHGHGHAH